MLLTGDLYKINTVFQIIQLQRLGDGILIAPLTKDAITIQAIPICDIPCAVGQIGNIDTEIAVAGTDLKLDISAADRSGWFTGNADTTMCV